jgi:hypothetical protein
MLKFFLKFNNFFRLFLGKKIVAYYLKISNYSYLKILFVTLGIIFILLQSFNSSNVFLVIAENENVNPPINPTPSPSRPLNNDSSQRDNESSIPPTPTPTPLPPPLATTLPPLPNRVGNYDINLPQQPERVSYGPAVQISCQKYNYPWCNTDRSRGFAGLVQRFYMIALSLGGAAVLGVMIFGAILWASSMGSVSRKKDAQDWISGALWGLVLLLSAYLLLYTINPNLVFLRNPDIFLPPVSAPGSVVSGSGGGSAYGGLNPSLSEADARAFLQRLNIGVKDACSVGTASNCVNLDGIKVVTLNEVFSLGQIVGGNNIYVTGGTEGCGTVHRSGQYSHCNGYKIDLRFNDRLNNYIESNFEKIGIRSDRAELYRNPLTGAIYAKESDHWDIKVN